MAWRLRREPVVAAAVLIVVGGLVWRVLAARGGWLVVSDDGVLAIRALETGLSWDYLSTPYNDHVMPGGLVAYWLLTRWFGLAYWPYLVIIMVGHTASAVVFFRLLRRMLASGWAPLLPLAIVEFTPITLDVTSCVSTALMFVPAQLATVWCLSAQVSYIGTRQRRHLVRLAAALAFGLLFFEKTLAIIPLVLLFTACLYTAGGLIRSGGETLRRYWPAWAVLGAVAIAYLPVYLSLSGSDSGLRRPASTRVVANFLYQFYGETLVPGVLGGPLRWLGTLQGPVTTLPPAGFVRACWLVALAVVALTVVRRPAGVRAWVLAGGYSVTAVAPVVVSRLDGSDIGGLYGLMPRFASDSVLVIALCLGVAIAGMPGWPPARPLARWLASVPARALGSAVALAVIAATVFSFVQYTDAWSSNVGRDFLRTAQAELAVQPPGTVYFDRLLAPDVMWSLNPRYERLQSTFLAADHGVQPDLVTGGETVSVIDDAGHVRPVAVVGRSAVAGPDACGWAVGGDALVSIPLDGPVEAGDWVVHAVHIVYDSTAETAATLRFGGVSRNLPVRPGFHEYFLLVEEAGDQVELRLRDPLASLCVDTLAVGDVTGRQ